MREHIETIDAAVRATVASLTNKADALDEAWSEVRQQIAALEHAVELVRAERDRYREKLDECVTDRDRWRAQALRDAAELERIEGSVPLRDRLAEVEADRTELERRLRRVTDAVCKELYEADDRAYLAERDQKVSAGS